MKRSHQPPQQHSPAQPKATEYERLHTDANALLDRADQAAQQGDAATEQRAEAAAGRLLDQARRL